MTPEEQRIAREAAAEEQKRLNAEYDANKTRKSIDAAIAYETKATPIEKLRRAQAAANAPEAIRKRTDFDSFTGE